MKRFVSALVLPMLVVAIGAGCQRSDTAGSPGEDPAAPAGIPAQAPAVQMPAATSAPAAVPPGEAAAQPPAAPAAPVPAVLPAVLATVNGQEVQRWELESAVKQAEAAAGGPVPSDRRNEVLRGLLDELITYHVLAQEARSRKLNVTDAEVEAEIAAVRGSFPTEEAFQQALLLQGVTADQLRQVTRLGMHARKIIDAEITSKVTIPDAEVDAFYKQNLDQFRQGDSIRASHIYIALPPDAPQAARNRARVAAEDVLRQVRAGTDFGKLAGEHSDDTTAAQGGDLGFFEKGTMPPDFEAVAFGLKPGQVSDVVELSSGLHIIKVTDTRGPRTAPLAEVREELKQFLLDERRQARLEEFIGQLKAKTKIQIRL